MRLYAVSLMALGYGTREPEPGSPAPVLTLPANVRTPPAEGASSDRSDQRRGRKGRGEKGKGKKKPTYYQTQEQAEKWNPYDTSANRVIVTKEVQDQMIAEKRAKALSFAGLSEAAESKPEVVAVVEDLKELEDLSDLPDYDDGEGDQTRPSAVMKGAVVGYEFVKAGANVAGKSLPIVDWFGRKLDSWGDKLLKKANMGFPFGPLAELTAGVMDWTTGKILSKESLADLLKKEAEERKKVQEKELIKLCEEQKKMEKKKDDAAKKEKAKKEKEEKRIKDLMAKGIDEELAKVLAEGAEPDEAEGKEEEEKAAA